MEPTTVKEKLIAVLAQIQVDSHLDCPVLTGATKPIGTLPEFTSKVRRHHDPCHGNRRDDPERRQHLH